MYRVTQENYGDEFERIKTCQIVLGQRRLACSLYRGALNGVTVYAIGNEHLFHRPRLYGYGDDSLRFAFFCRAVIDLLPEFGDLPDILHCNDWETALAILYLKTTRCCGRNFSYQDGVHHPQHRLSGAVRQKRDGSDVRSAGWLVSRRPEL